VGGIHSHKMVTMCSTKRSLPGGGFLQGAGSVQAWSAQPATVQATSRCSLHLTVHSSCGAHVNDQQNPATKMQAHRLLGSMHACIVSSAPLLT